MTTVVGQFLTKKGMTLAGPLPGRADAALLFLMRSLFVPYVFMGLALAFIGAISWMAAMTKLPLTVGYPFMALTYIVVFALSPGLLGETIAPSRWAGVVLISVGIFLASRT